MDVHETNQNTIPKVGYSILSRLERDYLRMVSSVMGVQNERLRMRSTAPYMYMYMYMHMHMHMYM